MALARLLEFDPRNRMRPLFFESDGNFRLQRDPRHLTSNLVVGSLTLEFERNRMVDHYFSNRTVTLG